jgi:hypothetical protein
MHGDASGHLVINNAAKQVTAQANLDLTKIGLLADAFVPLSCCKENICFAFQNVPFNVLLD